MTSSVLIIGLDCRGMWSIAKNTWLCACVSTKPGDGWSRCGLIVFLFQFQRKDYVLFLWSVEFWKSCLCKFLEILKLKFFWRATSPKLDTVSRLCVTRENIFIHNIFALSALPFDAEGLHPALREEGLWFTGTSASSVSVSRASFPDATLLAEGGLLEAHLIIESCCFASLNFESETRLLFGCWHLWHRTSQTDAERNVRIVCARVACANPPYLVARQLHLLSNPIDSVFTCVFFSLKKKRLIRVELVEFATIASVDSFALRGRERTLHNNPICDSVVHASQLSLRLSKTLRLSSSQLSSHYAGTIMYMHLSTA